MRRALSPLMVAAMVAGCHLLLPLGTERSDGARDATHELAASESRPPGSEGRAPGSEVGGSCAVATAWTCKDQVIPIMSCTLSCGGRTITCNTVLGNTSCTCSLGCGGTVSYSMTQAYAACSPGLVKAACPDALQNGLACCAR